MDNHNRYCEKCDKWLDSPEDYEEKKLGGDDIGNFWEYKCKSCGSKAINEQMISGSYSACGHCYNKLVDKETWNKHKPNWRKRFALGHEDKEGWGIIIKHDCQPKCELCRKEFKLTQEYVDTHGVWYNLCPTCSIKDLKHYIANDPEANEEDKKRLKELEKLFGKGNPPNRERIEELRKLTAEQEQELVSKKEELMGLEEPTTNENNEKKPTNWTLWIGLTVGIIVVLGLIFYLLKREKQD